MFWCPQWKDRVVYKCRYEFSFTLKYRIFFFPRLWLFFSFFLNQPLGFSWKKNLWMRHNPCLFRSLCFPSYSSTFPHSNQCAAWEKTKKKTRLTDFRYLFFVLPAHAHTYTIFFFFFFFFFFPTLSTRPEQVIDWPLKRMDSHPGLSSFLFPPSPFLIYLTTARLTVYRNGS